MLNPVPFNGQVYSSNLEVATSCSLGTPKLVCLKLVYWCQKQPVLTPATYNMVFFEKLEKVLMGVHNASPIILNKNLCKMFSNNLSNYSSSNAEDNTNDKWGITYLPCLNKIEWWKQKLFLIAIYSMQDWTAPMRHGVTRKRSTTRLLHIGNLFRKNLQLKDNC